MNNNSELQKGILEYSNLTFNAYERNNFKIIDRDNDNNTVFIFFSSNGIYYPNTESEFKEKILTDDKYEWLNIAESTLIKKYASRTIFVRDIYKQWYVTGINSRYNTINKTYDLLHELTRQYDTIITVGGSSGGYAAVILGLKLKAKRIFSFSGQFSIVSVINEYYRLHKYKDNFEYSQYYMLNNLIESNLNIPIYYFYPAQSKIDIEQSNIVKNYKNVYSFAIEGENHGKTINGHDLPYLLVKSDKELHILNKLYRGKIINPNNFIL